MTYPYLAQQYQPYYQPMTQSYQNMAQTAQQSGDDRIWVANQTAAESYLVAPGGFVRLWDSNQPVFYERRADATGRPMPTIAYRYTQVTAEPETAQKETSDYVRKNDIAPIIDRIAALETAVGEGLHHESE